ncbi:MAG: DUF692 domain-containing protein [Gammaproteobacteria bacterium]
MNAPSTHRHPSHSLPCRTGIGLRAPHYQPVLEQRPDLGWLEVHSENYFSAGGPALIHLERIRELYPLSFHGVGLSLGSADPLSADHLARLRTLVERFEPALVSEHLSWSSVDQRYLHDLLPLPHTREAITHVADRVQQLQDYLGREVLLENISDYLRYDHADFAEWEFLAETVQTAGCGLLLDVNNVYVNAVNHGFDPYRYIDHMPAQQVREIHLAGHTVNRVGEYEILIDTHNREVPPPVWDLYRHTVARIGARPTLIEWDADIPALDVLLREATTADAVQETCRAVPA